MGQVIRIHQKLHKANVERITRHIISTLQTTPYATDIADRVSQHLPGLNNWFIVKFIINRNFPAPSLCRVIDADYVETTVIMQLLEAMRYTATKREQNLN